MGPELEKREQLQSIAVKIGKGIPPTETKDVFAEISADGNTYTTTVNIDGLTGRGTVQKADGVVPGDAVVEALNDLEKQGLKNEWFVTP